MTDSSAATNAPIDVVMDGITYSISRLSEGGISELDNWVRGRIIRMARESCEGLGKNDRRDAMREAYQFASTVSWLTDPELVTDTPDGIARFVVQLIKERHPTFSMENLSEIVENDPDAINKVMEVFQVLRGKKRGRTTATKKEKTSTGQPPTEDQSTDTSPPPIQDSPQT